MSIFELLISNCYYLHQLSPTLPSLTPHTGAVTSVLCLGDAANAWLQVTGAFFQHKGLLQPAFWKGLGMGVGFWRIAELLFAYEAEPAALTFLLRVCCSESSLLLFLKNNGNLEKQMSIFSGVNRSWLQHPAWRICEGEYACWLGTSKKKKPSQKRDLRGLNSVKV